MRRIEDLLREKPMTIEELASYLPHSNEFDSTQLAVAALVKQNRIEARGSESGRSAPKYHVVTKHHDLASCTDWESRIDGLYEHLESISENH